MELLILLSMLGLGGVVSLTNDDSSDEQETDSDNIEAQEAPSLGANAIELVDSEDNAINVNHSTRSSDTEYHIDADRWVYDIETGRGNDTVVADATTPGRIFLGDGDDQAWGGEGRDVLRGEAGDDDLYGRGGHDTLIDREGENYLHGGDGNDFLASNSGSTMIGGDGDDTFVLTLSTDAQAPLQILDFSPDEDQIQSINLHVSDGETFDLAAVAREDGDGTDLMFDGRVLAEIFGASEDDLAEVDVRVVVESGEYTDDDTGRVITSDFDTTSTIYAEGGDDTVSGSSGDVIYGGDGDDLIRVSGQLTADTASASDMSTASGGAGDDMILSSNGNILTGGEGEDIFGLSLSQYNGNGTGSAFDLTETIITDFNPDEDTLYIEGAFISQAGGTLDDVEATMAIEVWENGEGADVLAGDEVIARVTGGQTLTVQDLHIAEISLENEFFGAH